MSKEIHIAIMKKVSHQYGIDQALGNKMKETKMFEEHGDDRIHEAYLEGYAEGKRQRLENLLTK